MVWRLFLLLLVLAGVQTKAAAQSELYYDQFDWGFASGNPGDLNTAFWSGPRDQFRYDPSVAPAEQGAARLGLGGQYFSRLSTRDITPDFPIYAYDFHAAVRLQQVPGSTGEENFEIAFRSNGAEGYLLTIDSGQDLMRLRRQGGGYSDLTPPVPVSINEGDLYYIRGRVTGFISVFISIDIATDPAFANIAASFLHNETNWLPFGDRVELIGFSFANGYNWDVDYFSIGEPAYPHSAADFARSWHTGAPTPPAPVRMGMLDSVNVQPDSVVFTSGAAALRITPRVEGTARVDFSPDGTFAMPASYAVTRTAWPVPTLTVTPGDPYIVEGDGWRIDVETAPVRLVFKRPDGTTLFREDAAQPATAYNESRTLSFAYDTAESIYGLGLHSLWDNGTGLDRDGRSFQIRNHHQAPSYLIYPFWTSSAGYGVFVDNPANGDIAFGTAAAGRADYSTAHGELSYYVFIQDTMKEVLGSYAEVTGRAALPPRWTFGNVQSKYGYQSFAEVQSIIDGFDTRDIPLDAVVLDLDWFGRETMGNLDFQATSNWSNPVSSLAAIRARGIKTIPITEPQMSGLSFNAADALAQGLVGTTDGSTPYDLYTLGWITNSAPVYVLDFTNPDTRAWWIDKHETLIKDYQFDGFWQDLNEPEGKEDSMVFHDGPSPQVHNVQALLMNRALAEAVEAHAPGKRPFIMSRSAYAGSQKYGAGLWSGDVNADWYHLYRQVALGLSLGMAGHPWFNSDIGGFNGTPSAELYVRWCQFGFTNPLYRPHGSFSDREPWRFGAQAEGIVRDLLKLRYRMVPYFYSAARETHDTGVPFMRPLILEWPAETQFANNQRQYLVGPNLMARPVTISGETEGWIDFPPGEWRDWYTGQRTTGPTLALDYPFALERFPLFVRTPSIIPLGPESNRTDAAALGSVTLLVTLPAAGAASAEFTLYEDDGLSTGYLGTDSATTHFTAARDAQDDITVTLGGAVGGYAGMPANREFELQLPDVAPPQSVEWNAVVTPEAADQSAYDAAPRAWFHDGTTLWIKEPAAPVAAPATVVVTSDSRVEGWKVY